MNQFYKFKKHKMKMKNICVNRIVALSFILVFFIFMFTGCGSFEINSHWLDREIIVDGNNTDWLGAMYYFEDDNISVGFFNDENYIFICMIAEDTFMRAQIISQGFTLWFDPEGGKEKALGIRFPLGMRELEDSRRVGEGEREGVRNEGGEKEEVRGLERIQEALESARNELEILGSRKDERRRMPVKEARGIDIKLEVSSGLLVYELRVPLNRSEEFPFAIGAKAGDAIGIGFESPKINREKMRERMGGVRSGGGQGGGIRGMGGGRGWPGMGRRPNFPNGLNVWAVVQLALPESSH